MMIKKRSRCLFRKYNGRDNCRWQEEMIDVRHFSAPNRINRCNPARSLRALNKHKALLEKARTCSQVLGLKLSQELSEKLGCGGTYTPPVHLRLFVRD